MLGELVEVRLAVRGKWIYRVVTAALLSIVLILGLLEESGLEDGGRVVVLCSIMMHLKPAAVPVLLKRGLQVALRVDKILLLVQRVLLVVLLFLAALM